MRKSGHKRRARRWLLLLLAGLLGAAAVVLPAVASSETGGPIKAVNEPGGIYGEKHRWEPLNVEVNTGGAVAISNPTTVNHGVEWVSGPVTPTCSAEVPVGKGPTVGGKNWTGTCTFTQPGKYIFYCTVHGAEMTATITVNSTGTTPGTTTTGPTGTTNTQQPGSATNPSPSNSQFSSPLAGTAASTIKIPSSQRGKTVHGSVDVSPAGAGGRLEVDLVAKSASLAGAGAGRVRVGKLVRSGLKAGKLSFSVPLSPRAKRALRRHGRLPLTAMLLISAPTGGSATITRAVLMRP